MTEKMESTEIFLNTHFMFIYITLTWNWVLNWEDGDREIEKHWRGTYHIKGRMLWPSAVLCNGHPVYILIFPHFTYTPEKWNPESSLLASGGSNPGPPAHMDTKIQHKFWSRHNRSLQHLFLILVFSACYLY